MGWYGVSFACGIQANLLGNGFSFPHCYYMITESKGLTKRLASAPIFFKKTPHNRETLRNYLLHFRETTKRTTKKSSEMIKDNRVAGIKSKMIKTPMKKAIVSQLV